MTRLLVLAALTACAIPPAALAGSDCVSCESDKTPQVELTNDTLSLLIGQGTRSILVDPAPSPVTVSREYALDVGTGAVTFGDGAAGAVPPTGTSVTGTYRTGSGGGATVSRVGNELSASVVTLKPALVALPAAADDEDDGKEQPG